jgi:hypothetical protein
MKRLIPHYREPAQKEKRGYKNDDVYKRIAAGAKYPGSTEEPSSAETPCIGQSGGDPFVS